MLRITLYFSVARAGIYLTGQFTSDFTTTIHSLEFLGDRSFPKSNVQLKIRTTPTTEADMAARTSILVENFAQVVSRINAVAAATRPVCIRIQEPVRIMVGDYINFCASSGSSSCGVEKETSLRYSSPLQCYEAPPYG